MLIDVRQLIHYY